MYLCIPFLITIAHWIAYWIAYCHAWVLEKGPHASAIYHCVHGSQDDVLRMPVGGRWYVQVSTYIIQYE